MSKSVTVLYGTIALTSTPRPRSLPYARFFNLKKIIEIEGNEHIINHHEKKIVLSKIVFNVQIKQLGNWTTTKKKETSFGSTDTVADVAVSVGHLGLS